MAHRVNSVLLSEFIQKMLPHGELIRWTVTLIGGGTGRDVDLRDDITVTMLKRTVKGHPHEDRYSIGRLMSPRDEAIDLDDAEWNAALARSRDSGGQEEGKRRRKPRRDQTSGMSAASARRVFRDDRIVVSCSSTCSIRGWPTRGFRRTLRRSPPSRSVFREAQRGERVEYKVNNVLWEQWEQEYGAAD